MQRKQRLLSFAMVRHPWGGMILATALGCTGVQPEMEKAATAPLAAIGDVDARHAVVWARGDHATDMQVRLTPADGRASLRKTLAVCAEHDFTGKIGFDELQPGTTYDYALWFGPPASAPADFLVTKGRFRTAPAEREVRSVRFAWGGDLGGQNVCRDTALGFPIFQAINKDRWDFFIGLGDMIYADQRCEAKGRFLNSQIPGDFTEAVELKGYWAHWKYNRADPGFRRLAQNMPYVAVWDDHEVVNDFGPMHDTRTAPPFMPGRHLLPVGLQAFLDYNPVLPDVDQPKRLYRTIRWGRHAELFILDTRQYRDSNWSRDDGERPKSLLGYAQLAWLKDRLKASDATWKIIVSSVPMSIPTGSERRAGVAGRDGWANFDRKAPESALGFERELLDVLGFLKDEGIHDTLWLTTDVHFAEVFRYTPFRDDPSFHTYEFVTGPLNAGLFPNRDFDTTFGTESLFFHGPADANRVVSLAEAKRWFNFGAVEIAGDGILTAKITDANGAEIYALRLEPHRRATMPSVIRRDE